MTARDLSSPELLRQLLRYDPVAGKLFWLPRGADAFNAARNSAAAAAKTWNTRFANREAFCHLEATGYLRGRFAGRSWMAHRVVWAVAYGVWPVGQIDHIDGDKTNNRLSNLREVDAVVNCQNRPIHTLNTSGVTGVTFLKRKKLWYARITIAGERRSLGRYKLLGDAVAARKRAEIEYSFHPNHGRPT